MKKRWIKTTPGVIVGFFKGKRIRIEQGDSVDDPEIVKIYPQDFKLAEGYPPPSSPSQREPAGAPTFSQEELEKLSKKELLEIAKELQIKGEGLKKEELVKAILEAQKNE